MRKTGIWCCVALGLIASATLVQSAGVERNRNKSLAIEDRPVSDDPGTVTPPWIPGEVQPGDANCDGLVNPRDAAAFAVALTDSQAYAAAHPGCPVEACDVNRDQLVDLADIDAFAGRLGPAATCTKLRLEPVSGMTQAYYPAPVISAVPLGHVMRFQVIEDAESQGQGITYSWEGAAALGPQRGEATFDTVGAHRVALMAHMPDGSRQLLEESRYLVVDVPVETIRPSVAKLSAKPMGLHEDLPGAETVRYFFGESIARLRWIASPSMDATRPVAGGTAVEEAPDSPDGNGHYVSSVDRTLVVEVRTDPPGFAGLSELRVDGAAKAMGVITEFKLQEPGAHLLEIGFPQEHSTVQLELYRTIITSHVEGDLLPEGTPFTVTAVTDPPGYEDQIVWLGSTKFGGAEPTLGFGPTFTTMFSDTWGQDPGDDTWYQWKGVKADETVVGQDAVCNNGTLETGEECDGDPSPCICPPLTTAVCLPDCTCFCIVD